MKVILLLRELFPTLEVEQKICASNGRLFYSSNLPWTWEILETFSIFITVCVGTAKKSRSNAVSQPGLQSQTKRSQHCGIYKGRRALGRARATVKLGIKTLELWEEA